MSPAERKFWLAAQRRTAGMQPDVQRALLRAFQIIRDSLSDAEITRIIDSGNIDRLIAEALDQATLDRAFLSYRDKIRRATERGFTFATRDLPKAGKVDGELAVAFDHLSPTVVTAIRSLETKAIDTLQTDMRDTVRAFVENGLRDGRPPTTVARELRSVIGLAPNQEVYVRNLRNELESGQYADAARRALLDTRFNLSALDTLSPADRATRIDTIVGSYRKAMIAQNAAVNATTTTFDAYKQGQQLAWRDAQAKGVIPDGFRTMKQWVHLDAQPDPRPEHQAMGRLDPVPADGPYQNGDMYAGESDPWNCHCTDRFFIERTA